VGLIPPRPPPFVGTREERREQMELYRDCLVRLQRQQPSVGSTWIWIVILIGLWIWGGVVLWG